MDTAMMIEIFGYIGSVMVVVSMLMSSIVKLRVINTIGSVISGTYAIICGALPLALMNICLIIINVYNLVKLLKSKQVYDLVEAETEEGFVKYFVDRYAADIKTYFPGFDNLNLDGKKAYVVCCDGNPAGVLIGEKAVEKLDVFIDYSTPAYRDCSVGTYLYSKLSTKGIKTLTFSQKETETHVNYMDKMGFVKENGVYVKTLI